MARGIISHGAYVPYRRLDRGAITEFFGSGGGKGTRTVASFDEDTTSLGVEAARNALRGSEVTPDQVWFSTTAPAYFDRTNATAVHAALRLPDSTSAMDMLGSPRSALGALRNAFMGSGTTLVVASDIRLGLPTSADEAVGGDAGAALLIGSGEEAAQDGGELLAEFLGSGTSSAEFVDRWRTPGDVRPRQWDERFSETMYLPLAKSALERALTDAGLTIDDVTTGVVTSWSARVTRRVAGALGLSKFGPDLSSTVGNTGAAHPGLALSATIDQASPGDVIALVGVADGCEVMLMRVTDAVASGRAGARPIADQIAAGGEVSYAKYLSWRNMVSVEPPRRPEPARTSSTAAVRSADWKFGFVGTQDKSTGAVHLPPSRASIEGGAVDDMEAIPMADAVGTVVTFTIDKLAYSPSPPIVFAVVDFDGGGRMPLELTDVNPGDVAIGDRVELTFRRLNAADGISNYFWKGRPVRFGPGATGPVVADRESDSNEQGSTS